MSKDLKNVDNLLNDITYIKKAIQKHNNILKYISLSKVLSFIAILGGFFIITLCSIVYFIISHYSSYAAVPQNIKMILYFVIALSTVGMGFLKVKSILGEYKQINMDITFIRLFKEVYTPYTLTILIPYVISISFIMIFLVTNGYLLYIVPVLAILLGLLMSGFVNVFYLKELILFGNWLIVTGLIGLFALRHIHPSLLIILTFGIGLILMGIGGLIISARERM